MNIFLFIHSIGQWEIRNVYINYTSFGKCHIANTQIGKGKSLSCPTDLSVDVKSADFTIIYIGWLTNEPPFI